MKTISATNFRIIFNELLNIDINKITGPNQIDAHLPPDSNKQIVISFAIIFRNFLYTKMPSSHLMNSISVW